jgi:hypothetical protein
LPCALVMLPFSARHCAGSTRQRLAAAATSMVRAVAPAMRSLSHASCTLLLVPVTWPPFPGLMYASPTGAASIRIASKLMFNSSASSMGRAVYTPWPISERSTMMVMELSPAIFSQAFSWPPAGPAAPAVAAELDRPPGLGSASASIKPPPTLAVALRKSRRLGSETDLTWARPSRAIPRRGESPGGFLGRYRSGKYYRTWPHRYRRRWVWDCP